MRQWIFKMSHMSGEKQQWNECLMNYLHLQYFSCTPHVSINSSGWELCTQQTYHLAVVGHWVLPIVVGHEGMTWSYDVIVQIEDAAVQHSLPKKATSRFFAPWNLKGTSIRPLSANKSRRCQATSTRPLSEFDPERFVGILWTALFPPQYPAVAEDWDWKYWIYWIIDWFFLNSIHLLSRSCFSCKYYL